MTNLIRLFLVNGILLFIFGCVQQHDKDSNKESPQSIEADSTSQNKNKLPETESDYSQLYGIYTHENANGGYSATLTLEPQGLNLKFTIVSSKGESCRGEATGIITIVDHKELFDTGYWIEEDCKIEFIFRRDEKKIDVKEIHLCTLHESGCGFEGTYNLNIKN